MSALFQRALNWDRFAQCCSCAVLFPSRFWGAWEGWAQGFCGSMAGPDRGWVFALLQHFKRVQGFSNITACQGALEALEALAEKCGQLRGHGTRSIEASIGFCARRGGLKRILLMTWNIEQSLANWRGSLPRSIMEKNSTRSKIAGCWYEFLCVRTVFGKRRAWSPFELADFSFALRENIFIEHEVKLNSCKRKRLHPLCSKKIFDILRVFCVAGCHWRHLSWSSTFATAKEMAEMGLAPQQCWTGMGHTLLTFETENATMLRKISDSVGNWSISSKLRETQKIRHLMCHSGVCHAYLLYQSESTPGSTSLS